VATAVAILEAKGFLVSQSSGRRRLIMTPEKTVTSALRIAILDYDPTSRNERSQIELIHLLRESGHAPFYTAKTLTELQMDARRVARLVKKTEADAWIICSAPREISEWFAKQDIAVFAQFGTRRGIPIAGIGPDFVPALQCVVRRLAELGHRRIVTLIHGGRREQGPGHTESAILDEMKKQGLPTGAYNLPSWEPNKESFRQCLESLFQHTPPSALLIEEPLHFFATLQFCGERGLRVPQDISLICFELAPSFAFSTPAVSHLRWDYRPMVRRITRWANNVACGKEDRRQTRIKAEFIEGGTVGKAPK
jgi:DNA-binding LacI/PurR family transcriptional regulator